MVIIPTYNEKDNIVPLVTKLLALIDGLEVLIVDDNSPDGTGELVRELSRKNQRVHSLHRPGKMGLGSAYVEGFKMALSMGQWEAICTMDADLSHNPEHLPSILEAAGSSDVVVGSRYLRGISVVNWSLSRIALSYSANTYARLVTRLPVRDCTSGFCCFNRKVIEAIDLNSLRSEGYAFLVELKYRAWDKGFTITEVPIIFHERSTGKSKISKRIILEALFLVWKLRFGL